MSAPRVSVIIPAYNAKDRILPCIRALFLQKTEIPFEIIVVDDGSADATKALVEMVKDALHSIQRTPDIRVLRQENAGPGAARNLGAENARGDILLFTDDDCIPEPGWLEKMAKAFEEPALAGAKGAYLTRQEEFVARFVQVEYEEKYDTLKKHESIDFIDTYSAGFRKRVFLAEKGYDERFTTASVEDQEFSFRLSQKGYLMRFVPDARVFHRHTDSVWGYFRKKFKIGYWKVLALQKNPGKIKGDSHTPFTLKLQVALFFLFFAGIPFLWTDTFLVFLPPLSGILFLTSTIPLTIRAGRRFPDLLFKAPFLILLRAAGLFSGLCTGFFRYITGQAFKKHPRVSGK